jgi:hypothetical protein
MDSGVIHYKAMEFDYQIYQACQQAVGQIP